jgi:hypothetical protein
MAMTFNHYLDIQFQKTRQRVYPGPAVYIRIRGRKVSAHKRIAREENLLAAIVDHDVVVAVARRRKDIEVTDTIGKEKKRRHQGGRLSDHHAADPR